jgi:nondiscriminating glutamyl-tRNA synthetase
MKKIKVRFAPSPTGYLHLGGLRTALVNYLFAKANDGEIILRIEDTDQTRKVDNAVSDFLNVFDQLGIKFDGEAEYQSNRLEIYKEHAQILITNNKAYYAFDTPEELEEMRNDQKASGVRFHYDGKSKYYSKEEIADKLKLGIPYVIRMRVPENEDIIFDDLIRGNIKINTNEIDEQILMKSDGFPTYHFANVVDDHLMGITHVIRAEEWITSVPKHILLYKTFGWDIPIFAHLPWILDDKGKKLSKRFGDVDVQNYLNKGYLPAALINYIALLGWNPGHGNTQEIFSINEIISLFKIENVNKSGAKFDTAKLDWINRRYIQDTNNEDLFTLLIPKFVDEKYKENLKRSFYLLIGYLHKLSDIKLYKAYYENFDLNDYLTDENKEIIANDNFKLVLNKFIEEYDNDIDETIDETMKKLQIKLGLKGKDLYQPIRIAITGEIHGLKLVEIEDLLGSSEIINRIKNAINFNIN